MCRIRKTVKNQIGNDNCQNIPRYPDILAPEKRKNNKNSQKKMYSIRSLRKLLHFSKRNFSSQIITTDQNLVDTINKSSKNLWNEKKFDQNNFFEHGIYLNSYSSLGFRLNHGFKIIGPIALFPCSVYSWNVGNLNDVNEDSLCLFHLVQPKIETLIVSLGDITPIPNEIISSILKITQKYQINVEILTTQQACTTFNFLNQQGKMVAAAMIPPRNIQLTDDDIIVTQSRAEELATSKSLHLIKNEM